MQVWGAAPPRLRLAVVAAVVIALVDVATGGVTAIRPLVFEFILHVVAIFGGFVVVDTAWERLFTDDEA